MRLSPGPAAILLAAAGVGGFSCARKAPAPPAPVTMRIGVGAPRSAADTGTGGFLSILKADPWLTTKPDGRIGDRIVTAWQWDDTGTTLRLTLRPDVFFHDGTRLTPEVAAHVLRATLTRAPFASFKSIRDIRVEPDNTLAISLSEPNAFLLGDLASTPVTSPDKPDVGTGPFQIASRTGKDAKLVAFSRYYRGVPPLAGIDVITYPTQRNAWAALMRDDIDMLYEVSRDAVEFVQAESKVNTFRFLRPYNISIVFNVRRPALKNASVRQAITAAIDREAVVRDALNGRGSVADGPLSPLHWAYRPPPVPLTFDPATARRLLDQAGFPMQTARNAAMPTRVSFKCLVFANDTRYERVAMLVQKQLAEVGIDMELVPLPYDQLTAHLAAGDFDAFIFELAGRSLSWMYEFWRSRPGMPFDSGYQSADPALDRLKTSRTEEAVHAAMTDLTRVFRDDPPAAFLVWQEQARAVSTRFEVGTERDRDILANLWQWRPAAPVTSASR